METTDLRGARPCGLDRPDLGTHQHPKSIGGETDDDNFTLTGSDSIGVDITTRDLLDLCLAENDRRMAVLDRRLKRPGVMPRLVRLVRPFLRSTKASAASA